jgi:predicted HicB family RNase H-like nuclease
MNEVVLMVRLSVAQKTAISDAAWKARMSMNEWVRAALESKLKEVK